MSSTSDFPSDPGTYVLFLKLGENISIEVGSLGTQTFPSGYYAYIGSAKGPGGLAGRLNRHLRVQNQKRIHWHVDRLITIAKVVQIWWKASADDLECTWAQQIAEHGMLPIAKFGASDCGCPTHLVWLSNLKSRPRYWQKISGLLGDSIKRSKIYT